MEWFSQNWFNLTQFAIIVVGGLVSYGKLTTKVEQNTKTIGEIKADVKELSEDLYKHTADSSIHVNQRLVDLFDVRFSSIKDDVKRVEDKVDRIKG